MARKLIIDPIEYVMSEMKLVDSRGAIAHGAIISPRYKDDPDSRFEGEQGDLVIAISVGACTRIGAYEAAIAHFESLKRQEILQEELIKTGKKKRKNRKK